MKNRHFSNRLLALLLACTLFVMSGCSEKDRDGSKPSEKTTTVNFTFQLAEGTNAVPPKAVQYEIIGYTDEAMDEECSHGPWYFDKADPADKEQTVTLTDVPTNIVRFRINYLDENGNVIGYTITELMQLDTDQPQSVAVDNITPSTTKDITLIVIHAYECPNRTEANYRVIYNSNYSDNLTAEGTASVDSDKTWTIAFKATGDDVAVTSVTLANPDNDIPFEWLDYATAQTVNGKLTLDVNANEFANGAYADGKTMLIANPRQFRNIDTHLDGDYKQMQDIDFDGSCGIVIADNGTVTPVDTTARYYDGIDEGCTGYVPMAVDENAPFTGTYDGGEHVIANVVCNRSAKAQTALFGFGKNCTFKNVTIEASCRFKSTGALDTASLVSRLGGFEGSVLENCKSAANIHTVSGGIIDDVNNVGGLVADCQPLNDDDYIIVNIKNCLFSGTVNAPASSYVGGIVGYLDSASFNVMDPETSSITECSNEGSIRTLFTVGGILGLAVQLGHDGLVFPFAKCTNSGKLEATKQICGGIVGATRDSYLSYDGCSNSGTVTAAACIGGICGAPGFCAYYDYMTSFNNCKVGGQLVATGDASPMARVGGVAGFANLETLDYFTVSSTDVDCTVSYPNNYTKIGGVFGDVPSEFSWTIKSMLQGKVTVSNACADSIGPSQTYFRGKYCGYPYLNTLE